MRLIAPILLALPLFAQVPPTAAAYESLLRLRTTATVLHITAHPDDEDGGLLTWLARSQGVRTGLLTLTRGEGGANLIGPELGDALGILRTEELLASDRDYGVDQFFTRAADFGFSKRLDETMEHWSGDAVLADCVRVIRLYRPDVIVSRFRGDSQDGHGNHQAAGKLAIEAFRAAADPKRFPDGLRPWQAKKLYRSAAAGEPGAILIDTGVYDPMLGESYRQFAQRGLRLQRSQGAGTTRIAPGRAISAVVLVDSVIKETQNKNIFDGIGTTLPGLNAYAPSLHLDLVLDEVDKEIADAIGQFDARDPSPLVPAHIAPALHNVRAIVQNVTDSAIDEAAKYELLFRLRNKEDELIHAANLLSGISYEAISGSGDIATPGQQISVTATLLNRSHLKLENVRIGIAGMATKPQSLDYDQQLAQTFHLSIPATAEITRPYWSRHDPYRQSIYQISQPRDANLPFAPPPFSVSATYEIAGVEFHIAKPVKVAIAPAISVLVSPRNGILPLDREPSTVDIDAQVTSNAPSADANIHLALPQGWSASPAIVDLHFNRAGEVLAARFHVSAAQVKARQTYTIQAIVESAGHSYSEGYETIAHGDLDPHFLYRPAVAQVTAVDVKVAPHLKIGYIMGAGDQVPQSLEQLGVHAQLLSPSDLETTDLSQFTTIIAGVRASAVRPDYARYNHRLLDYVKNGGHLIVEYQTPEFDAMPFGPFPFKLGPNPEEVSEEDAKVAILDPSNAVFNSPNKITAADFDGWVEERGSKFMSEWSREYKPLLESHDRDQRPQRGGLLEAHYGKGTFLYAAYAFYRQLPAGVPGAYRLFANMISLGQK